jgi:glyoxylase-like metal-dependent hydrolase (beta-lactamase superfamily II)
MEIQRLVVGQLAANCYLVIDEETRTAAVIDPGDEAQRIAQAVRAAGAELKHILLTHGHPDHSFAAGELQEHFHEAKVRMHEADLPLLAGEADIVSLFYDAQRYVTPLLGRFARHLDIVMVGKTGLMVLHTPGHSPGSVCYVSGKVAFTGDTLFAGGVGRTDLEGGSQEEMAQSLGRLLELPGETVIYPGHGPSSTIGAERIGNPWLA